MKIVLLLTISNLVISLANEGIRRYFMNIDCTGLTHEQCAAKADETYQEYCETNDDDCTNYNIFDYDKFSSKGIDYSTITECINNYGVIMQCECHEGFLDSSETQRGIICRTESGTDDELTTLKPIIPTTEPIISDISPLTSEQTSIPTNEATESEINTSDEPTATETTSTTGDVLTSSEQTTVETTETTTDDKLESLTASTPSDVAPTISEVSTETPETTTNEEIGSLTTSMSSDVASTISEVSTGTPETTTNEEIESLTTSAPTEREILLQEGWGDAADGVVYKLFIDNANLAEARSKCAEQGAILAAKVLRDPTSYSEISVYLESIFAYPLIGLNDIATEGIWVWEDGIYAAADEVHWKAGEPNNAGGEDCAHLHNSEWNDLSCESQYTSYLCERTTEMQALHQDGWSEATNGALYKLFFGVNINVAEARTKCAEEGAILAAKVLRDPTSYSEVTAHLRSNSAAPWIGLNDITTEGSWVWEDGVYATGDELPWLDGEPNDADGEDCAHLYHTGLNDLDCAHQHTSYLCEKNV